MGMYDYIKIEPALLPLTPPEIDDIFKESRWYKPEFQTKDFECEMSQIHLNKDSIVIGAPYYATGEEADKQTVMTDHHGFVYFYTTGQSKWFYEFSAKYTDGHLVEVKRLHESEAFWNKDRKSVIIKELQA